MRAITIAHLSDIHYGPKENSAVSTMLREKGVTSFAEDEPHIEPIFGGIRVMFLEGPGGESIELLQNLK